MKHSILQEKGEAFSVRVVKMKKHLQEIHSEYEISRQVVRSGTSIGANIAEAMGAQSIPDFISKLHISLKEAYETRHWLLTLSRTGYITEAEFASMHKDCDELIRLLIHSLKKAKARKS